MKLGVFWVCCGAAAALALAGCASRQVQAPVIERAPPAVSAPAVPSAADTRPKMYTVKRGDTLFSIALDQGHDYKDLVAWNNLEHPNRLRPGQQLRLGPPATQESPVTVSPVTPSGRVETRPLGGQGAARAESAPRPTGAQEPIKSEPQARKLPYTPENVALLQRGDLPPKPAASPPPAAAPAAAPAVVPAPAAPPATAPSGKTDADADDEDKVDWGRPARGKIIAEFSEPNKKGVDIAGKQGDPVLAAATGRVIYSGEMRGYGKLVVIKHKGTYSSVYAHNREILVKEGQNVVKGQKIAEVGNTDSDTTKLHFEIRKFGKPLDPAKYLPPS